MGLRRIYAPAMAEERKDEAHVRMLDVGTLWAPGDATEADFRAREPHMVGKLETKRSPLLLAWSHTRATVFVASERGTCAASWVTAASYGRARELLCDAL